MFLRNVPVTALDQTAATYQKLSFIDVAEYSPHLRYSLGGSDDKYVPHGDYPFCIHTASPDNISSA